MRIKIVFKSHYKEVNEQKNYIKKLQKNKKTNLQKRIKQWHLQDS